MKAVCKVLGASMMLWGGFFSAHGETVAATTGDGIIQLSELDLTKITVFSDNGVAVRANKSCKNNPIILKGVTYESGVGTHAPSKAVIELNGATSFHAVLGVDDETDASKTNEGIVDYVITLYKDQQPEVKEQGTIKRVDENVVTVDIADLAGYDYLMLDYNSGANTWSDHADWADARFTYEGEAPVTVTESEMYPDPDAPTIVTLPKEGANGEEIIPLSSLDLTLCTNGWGTIKKDKSIDGNTLTICGVPYESGVGMHATGKVVVKLNGAVTAFHAVLGIDDEVGKNKYGANEARCNYNVVLRKQNGEELVISTGEISHADKTKAVIDITENLPDYKYLILEFDKGENNGSDHVDVANAYFEYIEQNSTRPEMVSEEALSSGLSCATVMFSQPGVRYMHKLRSINPDVVISVKNLPEGLTFNEARCLVEGIIETEGEYSYTAVVQNGEDATEVPVSLTVSASLQSPVPFMGWLSWNVVQGDISSDVVETVADAFVSQGLLDAGYRYLVIDDLWHANERAANNDPVEDPAKFPKGMKATVDHVHSKGLKFGIYSDGGTKTCAGKFGSYGYETVDANKYAEWGVDLLKYDYCNAPGDLATCKKRYADMGKALKATGRDMVFYICEWGVREPWKWGPEALGSCWRATYDTRDCWQGKNGGVGIVESVKGMKDLWPYSGVNRYNDADMMCVGIHGTGKSSNDLCGTKPGMTMTEYRTQFAMWCMWSSPLSLSFDLRKTITKADLELMTNPELIAINQDRMGQAAEFKGEDENQCQLYVKDLENGDVAVAVLNMSGESHTYNIDFSKIDALDPEATYSVRDLQNREDCEDATGAINNVAVKSHETRVFRLHDKANDNVEDGIVSVTEALDRMTVSAANGVVNVCLAGTEGASKRILVSDVEGRVIASATSASECVDIKCAGAHGVYVVNVICGGRSQSSKIVL